MYLQRPIRHAKKKKQHFAELQKKVQNQLHTWKGKLQSFEGKSVLVNHALQSMPIYLLSATMPPKCVFKGLQKILLNFYTILNKKKAQIIGYHG